MRLSKIQQTTKPLIARHLSEKSRLCMVMSCACSWAKAFPLQYLLMSHTIFHVFSNDALSGRDSNLSRGRGYLDWVVQLYNDVVVTLALLLASLDFLENIALNISFMDILWNPSLAYAFFSKSRKSSPEKNLPSTNSSTPNGSRPTPTSLNYKKNKDDNIYK